MKYLTTLLLLLSLAACKKSYIEPYTYTLVSQPTTETTVADCSPSRGGTSSKCLRNWPQVLFNIGVGGLIGTCGIRVYHVTSTPGADSYVSDGIYAAKVFLGDTPISRDYVSYSESTYPAEVVNAFQQLIASGKCGI